MKSKSPLNRSLNFGYKSVSEYENYKLLRSHFPACPCKYFSNLNFRIYPVAASKIFAAFPKEIYELCTAQSFVIHNQLCSLCLFH